MDQSDWEEISQWFVGIFVVFLAIQLWSTKVKPWLADYVAVLREEGSVALGPVDVATSDVVAGVVVGIILLVVVGTVRSSMRAKKRARQREERRSASS